ncbi:ribosome silencing factor [Marivirga harenae]|uniref:ribosome silencing factor n=1 Tax=Marivirga harenae TaxID=2010992 RepID=UPI0026E0493B|nr:ribosome silencing factor [Marivirga harenae]WKV13790.1 ribosome silencing factor [Marivirga harenae]|tara:strand:- start:91798 stop:92151 length:354 start_codon:yes stop_codon:yes gene_type:complete
MNSEALSNLVVQGMQERKAQDITIIDLSEVKNAVADFFVICSATSDTQADSISESIEKYVYKETQENPWKSEGKNNREWILIDFVNVVAHVFKKDKREHYDLENLWGDAKIIEVENV